MGVAHGFVKHKRKTNDNFLIEQVKVDTQVRISWVKGLVAKDKEAEEVEADSEEVEETKLKN